MGLIHAVVCLISVRRDRALSALPFEPHACEGLHHRGATPALGRSRSGQKPLRHGWLREKTVDLRYWPTATQGWPKESPSDAIHRRQRRVRRYRFWPAQAAVAIGGIIRRGAWLAGRSANSTEARRCRQEFTRLGGSRGFECKRT